MKEKKSIIEQLPVYVLRKGENIVKILLHYDWVSNKFYFNLARVRRGDLYGLIDEDGDEVLPVTYNYISTPNQHGYANVRNGNLWGVYSFIERKEIIIPQYGKIVSYEPEYNHFIVEDTRRKPGVAKPNGVVL